MMEIIANMLKIHEEIIEMECKYDDSNRNYDKNQLKTDENYLHIRIINEI